MTRSNLFLGTLILGALTACDSSSPGGSGQVSLSVATQGAGSATASRPLSAPPDTMVDVGGNVLVLTKVEIVLRDIELERLNHENCDSVSTGSDDDCEEFEAGPVLIDLPLNGGIEHEFTIAVDSGPFFPKYTLGA